MIDRASRYCRSSLCAALLVALCGPTVFADQQAADSPPAAEVADALTLQQSRALMRGLRGVKSLPPVATPQQSVVQLPPPVPPIPEIAVQGPPSVPLIPQVPPPPPLTSAAPTLKQVPAVTRPSRIDSATMRMNKVMQTAGEEDGAGAVQLPLELPAVDMTEIAPAFAPIYDHRDLSGKVHLGNMTDTGVVVNHPRRPNTTTRSQTIFGFDGSVVKNNFRRGTTKFRQRVQGISRPFVDRYEEHDSDDYYMPILLVAAQEEEAEPVVEAEGSRFMSPGLRRLSDIQPTLEYAWGDLEDTQLPEDFHKRMDNGPYIEKFAPRTVVQWHPTNLWYYPLYFEDPGLERYGHTRRPLVQPFFSAGRFLGQVAGLPYQATLHPPHCPEYALGYYQPGEWAPKKRYQIPWNEEAAATEFLWLCGLILLIP
jgi:hypothetical protein